MGAGGDGGGDRRGLGGSGLSLNGAAVAVTMGVAIAVMMFLMTHDEISSFDATHISPVSKKFVL